jgi:site-specific recombinase XerC
MNTIRQTLPAFEQHLLTMARTSLKYKLLQVSAMRDVCSWHEHIYGCALTFADLTPETLRLYRAYRRQFDAVATLNRKRAAWAALCDWAVEQKLLACNPCERVRRIKVMSHITRRARK